jgi:predicted  nucleic acid-binding Zn-ribbon protein
MQEGGSNFKSEIDQWRQRQLETISWKERYYALLKSTQSAKENIPEGGENASDYQQVIEELREVNEGLRVKCEVLMEAIDQERKQMKPQMKHAQSMRKLSTSNF